MTGTPDPQPTRQTGFYWVRGGTAWQPAYYDGRGQWTVMGPTLAGHDEVMDEIGDEIDRFAAQHSTATASEIETRFWSIVDRDSINGVPSDMWDALQRLVMRAQHSTADSDAQIAHTVTAYRSEIAALEADNKQLRERLTAAPVSEDSREIIAVKSMLGCALLLAGEAETVCDLWGGDKSVDALRAALSAFQDAYDAWATPEKIND